MIDQLRAEAAQWQKVEAALGVEYPEDGIKVADLLSKAADEIAKLRETSDEICIGSSTSGKVVFTVDDRTVAMLTIEDAQRAADRLNVAIARAECWAKT